MRGMSLRRGQVSRIGRRSTLAAQIMQDADTVRYAYAGGCLAALSLDRWLAEQTGADHPLDAVLRHLYDTANGEGLTRQALSDAIAATTGLDCEIWLDRHVYGNEALPLPDSLF